MTFPSNQLNLDNATDLCALWPLCYGLLLRGKHKIPKDLSLTWKVPNLKPGCIHARFSGITHSNSSFLELIEVSCLWIASHTSNYNKANYEDLHSRHSWYNSTPCQAGCPLHSERASDRFTRPYNWCNILNSKLYAFSTGFIFLSTSPRPQWVYCHLIKLCWYFRTVMYKSFCCCT